MALLGLIASQQVLIAGSNPATNTFFKQNKQDMGGIIFHFIFFILQHVCFWIGFYTKQKFLIGWTFFWMLYEVFCTTQAILKYINF